MNTRRALIVRRLRPPSGGASAHLSKVRGWNTRGASAETPAPHSRAFGAWERFGSNRTAVTRLSLWLALGWFGSGCAARSDSSAAPKPGHGIAEYRELTGVASQSVATMVDALEALSRSSTPTLARFDHALHQLELTSVKARARAEAILGRGQDYFDEWKESVAGISNPTAARAETERYDRLFTHFERIRQGSGEVREEFRPFMAKLRDVRAGLDQAPGAAGVEGSPRELEGLMDSGRRVLQTLESVAAALDAAEAELHTMLAAEQ